MLGITFKENCPDVRNTKVVDVILTLESYSTQVTVYDPRANSAEVKHEYGLEITTKLPTDKFDALVLGVAHKEFLSLDLASLQNDNSMLYDVKGILDIAVDGKL